MPYEIGSPVRHSYIASFTCVCGAKDTCTVIFKSDGSEVAANIYGMLIK